MDIKNLTTFIQVAELSSFTQAAEKLGYSQSTISFQIRQLEMELGVSLFDRIGHTIALTDKGRAMLGYAHEISKLADEMEKTARGEQVIQGTVRIAIAESLCNLLLTERFAALHEDYPGITLEIYPAGTEEMLRLLNRNEADVVFTLDNHIYHRNYVIVDEEKIKANFVVRSDSPLLGRTLTKQELVQQPFLLTEKGMSYRRMLEEEFARENMEITPILESGNTDLLCRLVGQGLGVAFLPQYVTDKAVQEGKLAYLSVDGVQVEIWKQLFYHRDKWVSPQMKIVMEYLSK